MKGVSVLILTLNEEINLAGCIDSCAGCDDIVVLDSMSTDRTRDIAAAMGARVLERRFDNYAAQRNAGLTTVQYKHPWVLMIDADERMTPELAAEIQTRTSAADADLAMFRIRRKDFFLGRWLRRSSGYPSWFGRLVRAGRVRVEREVNEEYVTDGRIEHLQSHLHHYPLNKGIAYWFERHNRYSTMEAQVTQSARSEALAWRGLVSTDPIDRRRTLKQIAYRMPMRPLIVFLYLYLIRLGLLDGRAGLYYSSMRAAYEMLIDLKVLESARRRHGLPV